MNNIIETPRPIEYVSTMGELLERTNPEDPRFTKVDVYRLPNTKQLDERYAMVIAGPEAVFIMTALCERMEEFARTMDAARQAPSAQVINGSPASA